MNTRLAITPSMKDPYGVEARVDGFNGQCTVHWGDGTPPMHFMPRRTYTHSYPAAMWYAVTAVDGAGTLLARQQIRVSGALVLEELHVTADDNGIRIAFNSHHLYRVGLPYYRVDWQDGDVEHVWGVPGRSIRHDALPGTHNITVTDITTGRTQTYQVRVATGDDGQPGFTVYRSLDDGGMTVFVQLRDVELLPVHVWWDDADGPQLIQHPVGGMEIPHVYAYPGHYMITVAYAGTGTPGRARAKAVTVPAETESTRCERQDQTPTFKVPVPASAWADRLSRLRSGSHGIGLGLLGGMAPPALTSGENQEPDGNAGPVYYQPDGDPDTETG